ncbi:macro domain-containing protein [Oscillospiraceae bacterium Marseille-Q3528]|nr:macro domain-containing protein [Oscillospiraceae bacterium Marseille-Q3528]
MKQLVDVLYREIKSQIQPAQANIVRIEGIDNPIIYQRICQQLIADDTIDTVIPKITKEKYVAFQNAGKSEWAQALFYLHKGSNSIFSDAISDEYADNSFVDFNNAITKWRNESAGFSGCTVLILLMGTELAQDTGGLADTSFVISPSEIITNLSKDYSTWFASVMEENDIHEDYKKAIHTLYRTIFSQISTDIFKLSDFVDSLSEFDFSSVQELVAHICETLNSTWGIPSVIDRKAVPKVSALNKGTLSSAKIITSAIKFIERADDIPTASAFNKLKKKFDQYVVNVGLDISLPFPADAPVFADYAEFQACVIDFLQGIDLELNRSKLLQVDYAIINAIVGTKLPVTPKEKVAVYVGSPVEAYSRSFLDIANSFYESFKVFPTKIKVRVDRISLSDCTDDQKEDSFMNICNFAGGILKFFNELTIDVDGEILSFEYDDPDCDDPFDFANYDSVADRIKSTGKWGDPCKVMFNATATNDEHTHKYEFRWAFSPYTPWLNAFSYLADVFYSKGTTYALPTIVTCDNVQDYLDCESEDEFYAHLQQFRGHALYDEHKNAIRSCFGSPITGLFDLVCNDFKNFALSLTQHGLFNSGIFLRNVVKSYTSLLKEVYDCYGSFTDIQKEKMALLINVFTMSSNPDIIGNCDMGDVIVPAYSPIMLEKIDAQQLFLRQGFKEIFKSQMSGKCSSTVLVSKYNNLIQLSAITQAADAIRKKADEYLICKNTWEYYGIYYGQSAGNELVSSSATGLSIVTDDEDSSAMLQSTPMSNVISRNILDYVRTFPARIDGLNVAFVAPTDMQHIVAAIHSIAKKLDSDGRTATINLKIICINSKKNSAAYLRRWLDSYFSDEKSVNVNTYLQNTTVQSKADVDGFNELLENYDLCFTYGILQSSGIQFDLSADDSLDINYEKFPMTFTPDTIPASHGKARRVNISQFQFFAAKQHTQTSHIVGYPHSVNGTYRVYRTLELPDVQETIIDIAHRCCKWVVCVDQAIDRHMLESTESKIIGFTTGEGSYGELNVTVSARKDILSDIKQMLRKRITEKFTNWDTQRLQKAADFCVDELSQFMDGSRILKALNPYDYEIHSFLAYVLTLQMLGLTHKNNDYIVRALISLDSYKHWFAEDDELSKDNKRPDFMLIEIPYTPENITTGNKLHIKVRIIECKMGFQNENHISKAKTQLEKGINTMAMNWRPSATSVMHRYWLNQLYRAIIFSPLNMDNSSPEYDVVRNKIYGILNGEYDIEWNGDIFAFWLDENSDKPNEYEISSDIQLNLSAEGIVVGDLICHNCGQMFIQKMLLPEDERTSHFDFNNIIAPEESCEEDDDNFEESTTTEATGTGDTIPSLAAINIPFIHYLSDGIEHGRSECLKWFVNHFNISEPDKKLVYPSNGHLKYETVFDAAITEFRKMGLLENSSVGALHITSLGKSVEELIKSGADTTRFAVLVNVAKTKDNPKCQNSLAIQKSGITNLSVDCIVNAANERLMAGGGVCGAIFKAAGYAELQKACNDIGHCNTGNAVITSGFKLPCQFIIHAVGPMWHGGYSGEKEQLADCYHNALLLAVENNCHSIAFPLISSGIFGYPKEEAWEVAINTILAFLASKEDYGMNVIISVIDDDALSLGNSVLEKCKNNIPTNSIDDSDDKGEEADSSGNTSGNEPVPEGEPLVVDDKEEKETNSLEEIRVLIGKDKRNIPVYWEFGHEKLANRHILITGTSGQGKTYAIQTMILELARQNISSVVFDYTDGFLPGKLEPEFEEELEGKVTQEVAILNRIPVNPFRLQMIEIPPFGSVPEKSTTVAGRISDILKHVYSFGDQQAASIYAACKQGVDQYGTNMDFAKLRQLLEAMGTPQSKSVLSKMAQFFDMDLFDSTKEFNWKEVAQGGGKVSVIQLTGLDRELQTVVTEIMMWDAWYSLTKFGNKETPFVVVLDEAQNLSFKEKSPAEKILREGRKYGWSAWFATQFLKGALDSGEISNLQQAAERLYFKPTGEEMSYIAEQIADSKSEVADWLNTIKGIQKGQCIVQGDRLRPNGQFGAVKPTLVSVSSFSER